MAPIYGQIPSDTTQISAVTFLNQTNITELIIPDCVNAVSLGAFKDCNGLKTITIPQCLADDTVNQADAVFQNTKLAELRARKRMLNRHDGNIILSDFTTTVTSVIVSSVVTSVGPYHFYKLKQLQSVLFKGDITSIGKDAFEGCENLTSVIFDGSVGSIGESAFKGCTNLSSVVFSGGVGSIGENAFEGCTNLASINIPSDTKTIGKHAFKGCANLLDITFCGGISKVDEKAFYALHLLSQVALAAGVTEIGESAFEGCQSLCSMRAVPVENATATIGKLAFAACIALSSVEIPVGFASIGEEAFIDCHNLSELSILSSNVDIDARAFLGDPIETVSVCASAAADVKAVFATHTPAVPQIVIV